jgi:hypothetical protein
MPKRILELFSGLGHVSKCFVDNGWESVNLDYDPKLKPDICVDILQWDYTGYDRDHFDFIWASPDCTSWSICTHRHRTLKDGLKPMTATAVLGERLIHRMHEILDFFQPLAYIVEKDRKRLRHFPPMRRHPYRTTVFYSNYGFTFHKPTDLWSNIPLWDNENPAAIKTTPWSHVIRTPDTRNVSTRSARSAIPLPLIERVYGVVNEYVESCVLHRFFCAPQPPPHPP